MPVYVSIIYPREADSTFDMDYYLATHMPLVEKNWTPFGLEKWEVIQYGNHPLHNEPAYNVQVLLTWTNEEGVKKAMNSEETRIVFEDIMNFSNKPPNLVMGSVVGSGNVGGSRKGSAEENA